MKYSVILAAICSLTFAVAAGTNTGTGSKTTGTPPNETRPIGMGSEASPADNKLAQTIRDELKRDTTLSSRAQDVRINSLNGEVTVSGMVATQVERDKVEAVARRHASGNKLILDVTVE